MNLEYFKNRGAQLQAASGEHWKTMFKISLVILRGDKIDAGGGGGGGGSFRPPKYTPDCIVLARLAIKTCILFLCRF